MNVVIPDAEVDVSSLVVVDAVVVVIIPNVAAEVDEPDKGPLVTVLFVFEDAEAAVGNADTMLLVVFVVASVLDD